MRHLHPGLLPVAGLHVPLVCGRLVLHVRRAQVGVEHPARDPLSLHVVVGEVVVALRRYLENVAMVYILAVGWSGVGGRQGGMHAQGRWVGMAMHQVYMVSCHGIFQMQRSDFSMVSAFAVQTGAFRLCPMVLMDQHNLKSRG